MTDDNSVKRNPVNNIVASLDREIDEFFGLDRIGLSHRRKEACVRLCDDPSRKDGAELVRRLLSRIAQNRSALTEASRVARGVQTWRWKKNTTLSPENKSLEVRIERAIVRLLDDDWVNQVPTASGLTEENDPRRSVDIVHRRSAKEFVLIELKALRSGKASSGNQSPLFAAMEVLKYGLIFLYCKENRAVLYPDASVLQPVLEAERIHLEVLATPNCYQRTERTGRLRIAWLHQLLIAGLAELNRRPCSPVSFNFAFNEFPEEFIWTDSDHVQLLTSKRDSDTWVTLQKKIKSAMENRKTVPLL